AGTSATPTITGLKSTTVWQASLCALLLLLVTGIAPAAESQITLNDLSVRAEAGDRNAMRSLAEAYYAGQDGAEQDFAKAADWYRRLAKTGDPRAQTSLGLMHARGYGVAKSMV